MDMQSLLGRLSAACCVTGRGNAAVLAEEALKPFAPAMRRDSLGNLIAPVTPPRPDGLHLMMEAHLDEIGFTVVSIDDNGFLRFGAVGGPDPRVLPGQEVTVFGREELCGVVCFTPPRLLPSDARRKSPEIDRLAIDVGLGRERAGELVSPGDIVVLRREPTALLGGRLTGKALDNRAGVVAVLRALELLGDPKPPIGLTVLLSLGEELGERGAKAAASAVAPTHALVVDVSHALTPDAKPEECGELGRGPMIGVSPILDAELSARLHTLAAQAHIPCQTEAMSGSTGTDSDVISVTGPGVRTALVSIPQRYMHTAAEVIQISDVEDTARLMAAYIRDLAPQTAEGGIPNA